MILWAPGVKPVGTLHDQDPLLGIWTVWVTRFSDSILMVMLSPAGPLPKKAGLLLVTVSPSLKLSRITVVALGVA